MTLGDYLAAAGRTPWRDGEHDCCTFPADWAIACGCPDPMAKWRGTYSDGAGAAAIIEAARGDRSGLETLWMEGCGAAGIAELGPAFALAEGDIGVIAIAGEQGATESGAIFTGKRWAFLAPRGLLVMPVGAQHVIRVWSPCPR